MISVIVLGPTTDHSVAAGDTLTNAMFRGIEQIRHGDRAIPASKDYLWGRVSKVAHLPAHMRLGGLANRLIANWIVESAQRALE
jgi:hypothetical protein